MTMFDPTPEQIEAAAKAIRERSEWPSVHWPDIQGVNHLDTSSALARAALVAAAGAAPQERREVYLVTVKLPKNPAHNPRSKVTDSCAVSEDCTDSTGEHHTYLARSIEEVQQETRHITRIETAYLEAPVQIDEAKLADVISGQIQALCEVWENRTQQSEDIAHAVAEWLRGGGHADRDQ